MNETKLKLIKILEPYMSKDLSEGCVAQNKDTKRFVKIINYNTDWFVVKWETWILHSLNKWYEDEIKIIWHYDISAVLKYVNGVRGYKIYLWGKSISIEDIKYEPYNIWSFPNKPLHLYSEQEEKDLLELLIKL